MHALAVCSRPHTPLKDGEVNNRPNHYVQQTRETKVLRTGKEPGNTTKTKVNREQLVYNSISASKFVIKNNPGD